MESPAEAFAQVAICIAMGILPLHILDNETLLAQPVSAGRRVIFRVSIPNDNQGDWGGECANM
jgi:hypothetical protein